MDIKKDNENDEIMDNDVDKELFDKNIELEYYKLREVNNLYDILDNIDDNIKSCLDLSSSSIKGKSSDRIVKSIDNSFSSIRSSLLTSFDFEYDVSKERIDQLKEDLDKLTDSNDEKNEDNE